jgi:hypothetical protein
MQQSRVLVYSVDDDGLVARIFNKNHQKTILLTKYGYHYDRVVELASNGDLEPAKKIKLSETNFQRLPKKLAFNTQAARPSLEPTRRIEPTNQNEASPANSHANKSRSRSPIETENPRPQEPDP